MESILEQLVAGIALGGTYALVALGFVLIFGVLGILNIAHALTIMICPMTAVFLAKAGLNPIIAMLGALALTVLAGLLIFQIALRPFVASSRESTHLAPFIATFGVSMLVENGVSGTIGSDPRPFDFPAPTELIRVGGLLLSPIELIIILVVAVVLALFAYLINRTHFGRVMRGIAEQPSVVAAQGVNVDRSIMLTVMLASFLGGVSGVLFAALNTVVAPFMGFEYGLKGLVVMIVGGVSSPLGAVLAGLLLGVLETMTVGFGSSEYRDVITFGLLFAILIVRPEGLFVGASRESRL